MKKSSVLVSMVVLLGMLAGCISYRPTQALRHGSAVPNMTVRTAATLSALPPTYPPDFTPSPNAVPLSINGETVLLEFIQNGTSIPIQNNAGQFDATLKPEPFTLMVHGNKRIVSVRTFRSADMLAPLTQATRPVVSLSPDVMSMAVYPNDFTVEDKPLEISPDMTWFSSIGESAQDAADADNFLKTQLGEEPLVLTSGRQYLGDVPNYIIETIDQKPIRAGDTIRLVVFAEHPWPEDPQKFDWSLLKWLVFKIDFRAN